MGDLLEGHITGGAVFPVDNENAIMFPLMGPPLFV
jgi:hypothetical protein